MNLDTFDFSKLIPDTKIVNIGKWYTDRFKELNVTSVEDRVAILEFMDNLLPVHISHIYAACNDLFMHAMVARYAVKRVNKNHFGRIVI